MNQNSLYILFIAACIPTRLLYAYLLNTYSRLAFISVIVGIMFIYRGITWDGEKGIFGDVLWWNKMRFVHGIINILAYRYPKLLYADVVVGLIAKTANYIVN